MFEKFFEKPKAQKVEAEKPEQIAKLGKKTLIREANLGIEPKRSGGYMLCTVLAMALAMGMTAGKAEAQVRGVGSQGQGFGGRVASEIFHQGTFEVGSAINRAENAKQDRIEQEYTAKLTKLEDAQKQLDHQYSIQKDQLVREGGNQGNLKNLEDNYLAEKAQLMKARADLEKEYQKQNRNSRIKSAITKVIVRGARGW